MITLIEIKNRGEGHPFSYSGGVTMKKMMIILIPLLLIGCATTWNHPNQNQDRLQGDVAQCHKDAIHGVYLQWGNVRGWNAAVDLEEEIFQECMKSLGYYKRK